MDSAYESSQTEAPWADEMPKLEPSGGGAMMQAVLHQHPNVDVEYQFIVRSREKLGHLIPEIREELEKLAGLQMREGEPHLYKAFTPLTNPQQDDSPTVLVLLSRQSASDNLAVRMFARALSLSPTEEVVMLALCRGLDVQEIAAENGVAISTVRSQVKTLREKAGASSVRRLLQRVNSLPPVVPALRIITPAQTLRSSSRRKAIDRSSTSVNRPI